MMCKGWLDSELAAFLVVFRRLNAQSMRSSVPQNLDMIQHQCFIVASQVNSFKTRMCSYPG